MNFFNGWNEILSEVERDELIMARTNWLIFNYILKQKQEASIALGNGLAPDRWQAIMSTNDDPVHCCISQLGHQWPS